MQEALIIGENEYLDYIARAALAQTDLKIRLADTVEKAREILFDDGKHLLSNVSAVFIGIGMGRGGSAEGLNFLGEIQGSDRTKSAAIFLVSLRSDMITTIAGFSAGADDIFVVNSTDLLEIKARVEMRLRKNQKLHRSRETIEVGILRISTHAREVTTLDEHQEIIRLTNKEFGILQLLAIGEGRALSRSQIVDSIWGNGVHVLDRTVDSHICSLRKKLGRVGHYVQAVPGSGYRLITSDSARSEINDVYTT